MSASIPVGFCQCGCGQATTIAPQTSAARGWLKGQPIRFRAGHRTTPEKRTAIKEARRAYVNEWQRRNPPDKTPEWIAMRKAATAKYYRSLTSEERAKINERRRERYRKNGPDPKPQGYREWHRDYLRKWRVANSAMSIAYTQNRRAKLKGTGGSYTAQEWNELVELHEHRCVHCRKQEPEIKLTVDHVVPVVRGGRSTIDNIQPLCGPCNSRKGAKEVPRAA